MTSRIKVLELERENLLKRIQEIEKEIADLKRTIGEWLIKER